MLYIYKNKKKQKKEWKEDKSIRDEVKRDVWRILINVMRRAFPVPKTWRMKNELVRKEVSTK